MESEDLRRIYSRYARFGVYAIPFGVVFAKGRKRAIELLAAQKGDRVLEVGVGTGLTIPYYPEGVHLVGVDFSEPMLEKAQQRLAADGSRHVALQTMNATALGFADESFDGVVAAYVMSAVPQPKQVLSEMIRVCKPGGRIVFINHFQRENGFLSRIEAKFSPFFQRVGFRTDLKLSELLDGARLRVLHTEGVNVFRYWTLVSCRKEMDGQGESPLREAAEPRNSV